MAQPLKTEPPFMGTEAGITLPEPEDAEEGRGRKADVELLTMGRIIRLLEELDRPAQERVMCYLWDRYRADMGIE